MSYGGTTFTAGSVTALSRGQQHTHTTTTSEFGGHIGYDETHDRPTPSFSCKILESLSIRVWKCEASSGRGHQDVCSRASDLEQRISPKATGNFVSPSHRAHFAEEQGSSTADECLDTAETYSPGAPKLDPGHIFAAVVDEVSRTAVEKFSITRKRSSRGNSMDRHPLYGRTQSWLGSRQDTVTAAPSSHSIDSNTVLLERSMETGPRVWPCPFFVKDKKYHISCLTRHCLLSLADVREHLCLMHRNPIYCSVCYEIFPTVRLRDRHMRGWKCLHQPPVTFHGITDRQVRALDEQESTADMAPGSQLRQWFEIWRVVFPCTEPPPGSCFFSRRELEVYELRRFWKINGEDIISDVLGQYRLQEHSMKNEERNLEALYSVAADHAVDDLLLIQTTQATVSRS